MEYKIILNSLLDLFFPNRCVHCDDVINSKQFLCVKCSTDLSYSFWELNKENLAYKQLKNYCDVNAAYSLYLFKKKNPIQSVLHEIKYKNRPEIGEYLANKLTIDLSKFDGIIPIPLHKKRQKIRGYNQIENFCKTLAKNNNIAYIDNKLVRIKYNKTQVFKDKNERLESLNESFIVKDDNLNGHYLLVDDLLTTGSTLSQAVLAFRNIKDVNISVITIACA